MLPHAPSHVPPHVPPTPALKSSGAERHRVAAALRARRLVYLCDVPGLMRDVSDPESLISTLRVDEVEGLVKDGTISKGMIPKTDSAVDALKNGVHRVHFIDGKQAHSRAGCGDSV